MNAKRLGIALGAAVLVPTVATVAYVGTNGADTVRAGSVAASDEAPEFEPVPDAAPPPRDVNLKVETINGSGCPAGTTKVTPTNDNAAFTVTYQKYVAWAGGDAPPTEFRKNCQINVHVDAPKGYTYAVIGVVSRGFAHVEPGATALQSTLYYFQGSSGGQTVSHELDGPYHGAWRFRDRTDPAKREYAPCDKERNLNINSQLRVTKGDSDKASFIAMEASNANAVYHLTWKRC
ncbi:DUF4360 domain-containing protein [Actinomadura spongiicola]|uniref:DUF4360 domain-containing protein n=1 Tax=Actinomadura spongiicola TaxID=2303421 RepID=A0A372GQG3_9ACTN|nr:DUF4360 domain-containing protein [Actinomadura spongiicola]